MSSKSPVFNYSIATGCMTKAPVKRSPKSRLVAIWPDGQRVVVSKRGSRMWEYGRDWSAGPTISALYDAAADHGVTIIREPINQGA